MIDDGGYGSIYYMIIVITMIDHGMIVDADDD